MKPITGVALDGNRIQNLAANPVAG